MTAVCSDKVKERLIPLFKKVGLPTEYNGDIEAALSLISHDKKCDGSLISVIFVDEIGSFRIEKMDASEFCALVQERLA